MTASALLTAGVAAFLSSATGVAQADAMNWDAVAQCESGGNWHANTGNGFYGGLQFKESTWRQFGGVGSPATASRDEQIAVANRVMAVQGPDAWPTCGAETLWTPQWQSSVRPVIKMIWGLIPH